MFIINRGVIYFKYSPDASDMEELPYRVIRPTEMSEPDFNTILNFFKKIVDETKVDGIRYADETLMKHNINHFCLSGGTVLFKIVENRKMQGSGIPELYGFYTPLSEARIMWIEIDKMCYLLASEVPGSVKDGPINYDMLSSLDAGVISNVKPFYKTAIENMVKELASFSFPISMALTCIPDELYPDGVKLYDNGMIAEKTDGNLKEIEIEFDEKKIRYSMGKCNQPLKSALLISEPGDNEGKKSGLFSFRRKGDGSSKAIRQWYYEYTDNGEKKNENCDYIKLDNAFEYSLVSDTFNAYTGKVGANADPLPRVEAARIMFKAPVRQEPEQPVQPKSVTPSVDIKSEPKPNSESESEQQELNATPPQTHETKGKPSKKPPKPSKSSKSKPDVKVHPLLAQAEERRQEESRTAQPSPKPIPPTKSEKPSKSKFGASKVHPLLAQAEERRQEESGSSQSPQQLSRSESAPRPEPRIELQAGQNAPPRRSRFGNTQVIKTTENAETLSPQSVPQQIKSTPLPSPNPTPLPIIDPVSKSKTPKRIVPPSPPQKPRPNPAPPTPKPLSIDAVGSKVKTIEPDSIIPEPEPVILEQKSIIPEPEPVILEQKSIIPEPEQVDFESVTFEPVVSEEILLWAPKSKGQYEVKEDSEQENPMQAEPNSIMQVEPIEPIQDIISEKVEQSIRSDDEFSDFSDFLLEPNSHDLSSESSGGMEAISLKPNQDQ